MVLRKGNYPKTSLCGSTQLSRRANHKKYKFIAHSFSQLFISYCNFIHSIEHSAGFLQAVLVNCKNYSNCHHLHLKHLLWASYIKNCYIIYIPTHELLWYSLGNRQRKQTYEPSSSSSLGQLTNGNRSKPMITNLYILNLKWLSIRLYFIIIKIFTRYYFNILRLWCSMASLSGYSYFLANLIRGLVI